MDANEQSPAPRTAAAAGWVAVGTLLAVSVAALVRGRLHPDEIFQYLEPAHRLAFGSGLMSWEWTEGLRNWAVPGALGGLLALCHRLGLEHPWALVGVVWAACAAVQALGAWALYRLVAERDGEPAALFALAVHATWGAWLLYAARPLGDALSVAPLLGMLLWAQRARETGRVRAGLWSGLLVAAAFVVRYPSAVFGLPVAVSLLRARRWRALAGFLAGAGAGLLALGLLDWWTWGMPWHSAWRYVQFNVLSGGAGARFGTKPFWWYTPILAGMAPLLLAWHFGRGLARRDVVVGAFVLYLATVTLLGHKESRFLVPLLPLWVAVAAGPAWRTLSTQVTSRRARWALGGVYALSSLLAATVQRPVGVREADVASYVRVGRDPTLTGLLVFGRSAITGGGRFYLHRDVEVRFEHEEPKDALRPLLRDGRYSHVLVEKESAQARELAAAGFCPLERWEGLVLWRRCGAALLQAGL